MTEPDQRGSSKTQALHSNTFLLRTMHLLALALVLSVLSRSQILHNLRGVDVEVPGASLLYWVSFPAGELVSCPVGSTGCGQCFDL